jgi:hypothetical protein
MIKAARLSRNRRKENKSDWHFKFPIPTGLRPPLRVDGRDGAPTLSDFSERTFGRRSKQF